MFPGTRHLIPVLLTSVIHQPSRNGNKKDLELDVANPSQVLYAKNFRHNGIVQI